MRDATDTGSDTVDLRSDTVTRPTAAMRAAMAAADVGDDVYGDDPTVNRLEARMAERFGFERALFFASGTQSNLAALMAHCGRGDEYLVGQEAHTYKYEQGGAAVLGSIQPQPLENEPDGTIALERIARAIKPDDSHFARTRLLALENTMGGRVLPVDYLRGATEFAHSRGLRTHLDGARLFNAIVKLEIDEPAAAAGFDSVSVCLSKGLGAPAGSVLLGSSDFIAAARRWRKALGGGMRQAGILAAAAACTRSTTTSSGWRRITRMPPIWRRDCAPSGSRSSRRRPISCSLRFRSSGSRRSARIWQSAASSHRSGRAPASPLISMRRAPRSMSRCGRFESFPRR